MKSLRMFSALALVFVGTVALADADKRLIAVSAIAERGIEPDLLEMNVEVWSKAATADKAQALGGGELKKVQAIFGQFKIKKEDIVTDSFSFGPEYVWDQPRGQNRLTGFRSTQTLRVTLRDIGNAGRFLDALTGSDKPLDDKKASSGVNVNNIQWDSTKRTETEISGLGDAVKMARRRADELAKAAGVKIKAVHRLGHSAGVERVEPTFARSAKFAMADEAGGGTELSGGQIKIRVSVEAEFEIE